MNIDALRRNLSMLGGPPARTVTAKSPNQAPPAGP